jgi:transposase-like protein
VKERWTPAASTGPVPYLNNVLEQDHRAIKRRVNASQGSVLFGPPGARWPATR